MYLDPQDGKEPMFKAAVRLLHNHGESLDPLQVLEVLNAFHLCICTSCLSIICCLVENSFASYTFKKLTSWFYRSRKVSIEGN